MFIGTYYLVKLFKLPDTTLTVKAFVVSLNTGRYSLRIVIISIHICTVFTENVKFKSNYDFSSQMIIIMLACLSLSHI